MSDLIIGILSSCFIIISKIIFNVGLSLTAVDLLIICSAVIAYNISRLLSHNYRLLKKNTKYYTFQIIFLGVTSSVCVLLIGIEELSLFIPPFILWFIYIIPLLRKKFIINIRENAILKIIVISFVWTWLTLVIPVSGYGIGTVVLFYQFLARFFFIAALAIANDLADINYDRLKGTFTIPVILGKNITYLIILICLVLFLIVADYNSGFIIKTEAAPFLTVITTAILILTAYKIKENSFKKLIIDSSIICHMLIISGNYFFS